MNNISIILNQYKEGHITEEEAIQLIEGLYYKPMFVPTFPQWPQPLDPWYYKQCQWTTTYTDDIK